MTMAEDLRAEIQRLETELREARETLENHLVVSPIPNNRLAVCEDGNYQTCIARVVNGESDWERLGLYRVKAGAGVAFVLAESGNGAKSQAECVLGQEGPKDVERIPFLIRGWSSQEF